MAVLFTDVERLLLIIGTLIVAAVLARTAHWSIDRYLNRSAFALHSNPANFTFIKRAITFLIYAAALTIITHLIPGLDKLANTLLASAGILSVVIGLATQQTFGNLISGIFIIIYKPFRVGDSIQLSNGNTGTVEDITLQFTVIRNPENRRIFVPNSVISKDSIINSTIIDDSICNMIDVGVGYETDLPKAMNLLQEIAQQHPDFYDHRNEAEKEAQSPATPVRVTALGDSAVTLRLTVWCQSSVRDFAMRCDLLLSIKQQFDEVGINMPYPHRTVLIQQAPVRPGA